MPEGPLHNATFALTPLKPPPLAPWCLSRDRTWALYSSARAPCRAWENNFFLFLWSQTLFTSWFSYSIGRVTLWVPPLEAVLRCSLRGGAVGKSLVASEASCMESSCILSQCWAQSFRLCIHSWDGASKKNLRPDAEEQVCWLIFSKTSSM